MLNPNLITSLMAVAMIALVIRGLMPYRRRETSPELIYFAKGLSWVLGIFMLRTFYWGSVRGTVIGIDPDAWVRWTDAISGPFYINAIFNLGLVVGCWYVLRAFHCMIPDDDRGSWHVFSAPFYPKGWCFARIARSFREAWKR